MKRSIETYTLRLRQPMSTAHGTITERNIAVVSLSDGTAIGKGEASTLPGFGLETQHETIEALSKWVDSGNAPDSPAASTAVESALAAFDADSSGTTLAEHLCSGPWHPSIATQAVIGGGDVEATLDAAVKAAAHGYRTLKLKVAAQDPATDIDRVSEVRRAVGPDIALRLDANCGWDIDTAIDILGRLQHLAIDLVEEPTPDPSDFARISSTTQATIAVDEHASDAQLVESLITSGAIGAVVVKPAIVGGPLAAYELGIRILEHGARVIVSSFMDGWVGLETAAHVAAALPSRETHGLGTAALFVETFPPALVARHGHLDLTHPAQGTPG